MASSAPRSIQAASNRLVDAWLDGADTGRATLILIAAFVAAWTPFHIVGSGSIGLHADLVEVFAWSRHPALGYVKHPPLGAWMTAAWFAVFPTAEWAFRLLAMTNAAIALLGVDLIARRYLSGDKRVLVLLLLLFTPFYQFFGERFASNQTLLTTWPLATYCFLRAFETRGIAWSALAGVAAAAAMLGKYFSVFMIAGFVVAALAHPARWSYLKSPSPRISTGCGLAVLSPHLYWLVTTGFQPAEYAFGVHGVASFKIASARSFTYLGGGLAYVATMFAIYLVAARPSWVALKAALWPSDPDRRMLVTLLASFLLLPAIAAPILGIRLTSVWTMQSWFLLPIVLLAPNEVIVRRAATRIVALAVGAFTTILLLVSPGLAWYQHSTGTKDGQEYLRPASDAIAVAWRQAFGSPLRIVMGSPDFAAATTFYNPDRPNFVPGFNLARGPSVRAQDLAREGYTAVCGNHESWCLSELESLQRANPGARRFDTDVTSHYMGRASRPRRIAILVVPPARDTR